MYITIKPKLSRNRINQCFLITAIIFSSLDSVNMLILKIIIADKYINIIHIKETEKYAIIANHTVNEPIPYLSQ